MDKVIVFGVFYFSRSSGSTLKVFDGLVGWSGGGWLRPIIIITLHLVELCRVELS